jgi:hypothetical protein
MRDSKWCHQHHKKLSNKNIIHTAPFVQFQPIVFSQHEPQTTCQFRNKFGECVCKNDRKTNVFCEEHFEILEKFTTTLQKLINLVPYYKQRRFTIDSFFKLLVNIAFFFLRHKHIIVSFNLNSTLEKFINMIVDNVMKLSHGIFQTSLVIHRKSKPFGLVIKILLHLRVSLLNIRSHVQIEIARDTLVSNNIKVNKLTEICLKQNEKTVPVFCKGIDQHVLKFIV